MSKLAGRLLAAFALLAATLGATLALQGSASAADESAVTRQSANLRSLPNTSSTILADLPAGTSVTVDCWDTGEATYGTDLYGSMWLQVNEDGAIGWIHSVLLTPVDVEHC